MVEFIHRLTGSTMWVHEDRVEEYKAAGHKLAATLRAPVEPVPAVAEKMTAARKKSKRS